MADFFLTSLDSIELNATPRACSVRSHVKRGDIEDGLLVSVNPPLPSRVYDGNEDDIEYVVLAVRWEGTSLLSPQDWPVHVYVLEPLLSDPTKIDRITSDNVRNLAWGAVYPSEREARSARLAAEPKRPDLFKGVIRRKTE